MHEFDKRVLDETTSQSVALTWYRIVLYRSWAQGWKVSPSHCLNQQLDLVWLKSRRCSFPQRNEDCWGRVYRPLFFACREKPSSWY